ncbi:MAG: hypothetical protein E7254_03230 [Lachnospiraceae bacterium]|nr:hypothetical protein [Lachnospiraceae bacterium]
MEYSIDLKNVASTYDLHEAIKETLDLPSYYGENLDALYDVLEEMSSDVTINFVNCADAYDSIEKYMEALEEMCQELDNDIEINFYK